MPGTAISGTVRLAPALAAKAAPNDVVYVFARAAEGPKMPLAILRLTVKDLPASFSLDDSMAMTPAMKISAFPDVVAGARISKSGSAAPSAGDLEGLSKPLKPGTTGVAVVIDTVLP
jgi:cytochrome c-type biogenesis protein CcmH